MDTAITTRGWQRVSRRAWMMLGLGLLALVAAGVAIRHGGQRRLRVAASTVTTAVAERARFRDVVAVHGTLQPREIVYLDAVTGGQVERILARPGDRVVAGQPLVVLRNAQLVRDVLDNAGRLIESITQVQAFETQLETNRATNEKTLTEMSSAVATNEQKARRVDPLTARGFYPRGDAEALHIELDRSRRLEATQQETNRRQEALRREQLPRLRSEQASLRRSLDATHAQLSDLVVRAPVGGSVTQIDLNLGQNRNRGDRLAEISSDAGFRAVAEIDEYYLPRLRAEQAVTLNFGGQILMGKVTRVRPEVKNGAFTVEIDLLGEQPVGGTPGAAIDGELTLGAERTALILPAAAMAGGGGDLFVLSPDGLFAQRRAVRFGRRNPSQVEVLAGVAPGERVIVSDTTAWSRIDRIELAE